MLAMRDWNIQIALQTALAVHLVCHWLHVIWIYAAMDSAFVIELQSLWNGALEELITDPMRQHRFTSNREESVLSGLSCAHPKPATTIRLWRNEAHKAFQRCKIALSHAPSFMGHWSGLRGTDNAAAARLPYSTVGVPY